MAQKYLSWPTFIFLAELKSICPSCLDNCNLFAQKKIVLVALSVFGAKSCGEQCVCSAATSYNIPACTSIVILYN